MNFQNRTLFENDNLPILRALDADTVDLIYLDPPFNSNMDAVFGRDNFRNEVIWKRTSTKSLAKRYAMNTDRILYYVKSDGATWNQQHTPYDDEYIRKTFRGRDKHGRWGTVDLSGGKAGSERACMSLKGFEPPPGRAWAPPARNKFPVAHIKS